MKLFNIIFLSFLVFGMGLEARTFEDWRAERAESFDRFTQDLNEAYQAYTIAQIAAFDEFVKRVGEMWGEGNVWVPDLKEWVRYTEDLSHRTKVDFDQGNVQLEWLVPSTISAEDLENLVYSQLLSLLLTGTKDPVSAFLPADLAIAAQLTHTVRAGDTLWAISRRAGVSVQQLAELNNLDASRPIRPGQILRLPGPVESVGRSGPPLLEGQVSDSQGRPLTAQSAATVARDLVNSHPHTMTAREDGMNIISLDFKLVPNHLRLRVERFLPYAKTFAEEHKVPLQLVLAVMEVESSFNPRARSYIPAFGLMQLVPSSGARDAYRHVFGQDRLVDAEYLYDPHNNVLLGTAYLSMLMNRYFSAVRDPEARMWVAIAAYNTGPGNVARAFTGTTNLSRANQAINSMRPATVFPYMYDNLPHAESRRYIVKIREAKGRYEQWGIR